MDVKWLVLSECVHVSFAISETSNPLDFPTYWTSFHLEVHVLFANYIWLLIGKMIAGWVKIRCSEMHGIKGDSQVKNGGWKGCEGDGEMDLIWSDWWYLATEWQSRTKLSSIASRKKHILSRPHLHLSCFRFTATAPNLLIATDFAAKPFFQPNILLPMM